MTDSQSILCEVQNGRCGMTGCWLRNSISNNFLYGYTVQGMLECKATQSVHIKNACSQNIHDEQGRPF